MKMVAEDTPTDHVDIYVYATRTGNHNISRAIDRCLCANLNSRIRAKYAIYTVCKVQRAMSTIYCTSIRPFLSRPKAVK